MLTAYHLLDMGRQKWDALSYNEKIERADALFADVVPILGLSHVPLSFVPDLSLDGTPVDGLAHTKGNIEVRYALLADLERLVTVLFHELGHQLLFAMWNADDARAQALRALYEITPARAARWSEPSTPDCLSHGEKDPDTLSYGVYTAFGLLFL